MATLSDLKEMREALDADLVSQADFDEVKRDYLRAKKKASEAKEEALEVEKANLEVKKQELRAKKEALEANKEFQKRELRAKEAFQQRKSEAELRTYALESIIKHGSSIMSEEQKDDLVRDYVKMSGLDRDAKNDEPDPKRQRPSSEERSAAPPQTATPLATLPAPADAPTPASHRTPRPAAAGPSTSGVVIDKQILRLLSMSDEQNAGFVRGYGKMSGLDRSEPASKRQRPLADERSAGPPQPLTPSMGTQPTPPADASTPGGLQDEHSNYSPNYSDDGQDDYECVEPETAYRCQKSWTHDKDDALVAALRAGQKALSIRIPGRPARAGKERLCLARKRGFGSPALRKYLKENPSRLRGPWSVEEDQTFIRAHKEGKTHREISAMLRGRTKDAVSARWLEAKHGRQGSAALIAYAAEFCKNG